MSGPFTIGEADYDAEGSRIAPPAAPAGATAPTTEGVEGDAGAAPGAGAAAPAAAAAGEGDGDVALGDPGLALDPSVEVIDGPLALLDQAILLALCLDVKNHNPKVGSVCVPVSVHVQSRLSVNACARVRATRLRGGGSAGALGSLLAGPILVQLRRRCVALR